ncbi:MAG TPA: diguanylate cyclase, partial [Symbiobacteriaceae bacterium]|nr:diguanylate cyclase [Symbiobacteriaceae bacterium]
MGLYKPAAFRYMVGMWAAAVMVGGFTVLTDRAFRPDLWVAFLLLTVMAAVSHLYPVRSAREKAFYVVANVFVVAAVFVLPPSLLTIHCVFAMLPFSLWNRRQSRVWYRFSFNTAQTLLAALACNTILTLVDWRELGGPLQLMLAMAVIALFPFLQGLMVAVMLYFNNGVRIREAGPLQQEPLLTESIMALFGALVAGLWSAQPWLVGLVPVPIVIIHSLMRRVQMVHLADMDAKTGLYNYRYFEQAMRDEFAQSKRFRRPISLMFMDLDYLRHINNQYGHLAGDLVLKEVAAILQAAMRQGDLVARFGGEEFVAMLPGTEKREAVYVAERIRRAVEARVYVFDGIEIRATISIGVVTYPVDGEVTDQLVRLADEVLYAAKAKGRNRVCVAGEGDEVDSVPDEISNPGHAATVAMQQVAAAAAMPFSPAPEKPAEHETAPPVFQKPAPAELARASLLGTAVVGGVVGAVSLAWLPWPYPHGLALLVLVLIAVVADNVRVQVYESGRQQGISLSMSIGAVLAAAVLLDLPGALLVGAAGSVAHHIAGRRRQVEKLLFNIGNVWLSTATAYLVFHYLGAGLAEPITWAHLLGPGVATLTFYLVNSTLLNAVIALQEERSLLAVWWDNLWFAPALILGGLTGAFAASIYQFVGSVGAVAFLTPILLLRFFFSLFASRTQQSIAELEAAKLKAEAADFEKQRTLDQLIVTVAAIIDARDRSVYGHSRQVARYAVAVAEEMRLQPSTVQRIRVAALLHDLGKIGVPESILHKPGRLTAEEYAIVKQHAPLGAQLLSEVGSLQD